MTGLSGNFAYYPLTLFDGLAATASIFVGWIVEGQVDVDEIDSKLRRVMVKWPLLAGRIEQTDKSHYRVKIPLGQLPKDYKPFTLTSTVSGSPITDYVKLPVPTQSEVLPLSLFMRSNVPLVASHWMARNLPLMQWHLTYFKRPGQEYTCIGLVIPHLLVDGPGFGVVLQAVEAEMLGQKWDVPPPLHVGENENELQVFLDRLQSDMTGGRTTLELPNPSEYPTVSIQGLWALVTFLVWQIWQWVWHKADRRIMLLPQNAIEKLVDDANNAASREGGGKDHLSTTDVLTAWIYKTVYADETNVTTRTNLCNMDYSRISPDIQTKNYIHNCFTPRQYPIVTVSELKILPTYVLASWIANAKSEVSLARSMFSYQHLQESAKPSRSFKMMFPMDRINADEIMTISDMSTENVTKFDWTGVGGGRTVCRASKVMINIPVLMANVITIVGEGEDGRTILEVALNARRMKSLEQGVAKLIEDASINS
ncbi:hypothetical protein BDZ97DRAFT_1416727 [Flammula alnicola]|nr:hypothetical protein BDZ97DRAFT_1416727 [Flammula alnicola]